METDAGDLKERVRDFSLAAGMDIVGFAPVERWDEFGEVPPEFRPRALWDPARTVVVAGVQMPLPIVDTTPSFLHRETYNAANRVLDDFGFNLTRFLNRQGHAAYFFTRDGFASLRLTKQRPPAAFSHMDAANYAGLGNFGVINCILTPEFGPRVRFVSVFTSAVLGGDPMIEEDVCIHCQACVAVCPVNALSAREDRTRGDYNVQACNDWHIELNRDRLAPCGTCTKACPVGEDRELYQEKGYTKKYLREAAALAANPDDPEYKSWTHVRTHGSWRGAYPRKPKS